MTPLILIADCIETYLCRKEKCKKKKRFCRRHRTFADGGAVALVLFL